MFRKARRYSWRLFAGDCFGGVIAALIALPYGLSMAALMGLPPVLGVLTSVISLAFLGRKSGSHRRHRGRDSAVHFHRGKTTGNRRESVLDVIHDGVLRSALGRYVSWVPQSFPDSPGIGGIMVISQLHVLLGLPAPGGSKSSRSFSLPSAHRATVEP